MDNTDTQGCALHNPSLPTAHVERDGIFDMIGAKRLPGQVRVPEAFTVLYYQGHYHGLLRTEDRKVHVIPHEASVNDWPISNVVMVEQGQKLRISQDYWIFDASTGTPRLVDC